MAEQQLHLEPGLNVITGESGSGKSVLIDALGQLLGDQASEGTVRPPASQATIEGTFRLAGAHRQPMRSLLLSLGLPRYAVPQELESLVLRREIAASSGVRTRSYLNGAKVTRKVLKEVARALVDVNGQHSAYAMQKAAAQQAMLDRLGPGLTSSSQLLHKSLRELQEARSRLATFETMGSESVRQRMHQLVDDVTAARVEPGEDVSLRKQLRELDSRRDAAERCRLVSVAVGSDASGDGMLSAMDTVKQHVQTLLRKEERLRDAAQEAAAGKKDGESSDDDSALDLDEGNDGDAILMLQGAIESLMVARHALQDAESTVEQYARKYRFGQAAYDSLAERLQLVERVMKQHDAVSADQLVEEAEAAVLALDNYYMNKERQEEMEAEVVRMEERLIQEAVALSRRRRAAAERLTRAVQTMLCELAMEGARFDVQLRWTPAASSKVSLFSYYTLVTCPRPLR